MNKIFWLVVIASSLIVFVMFAVLVFERHDGDDDVFIKIAIWRSWQYGDAPRVTFFVISNDGTLTSYIGISRSHGDITRRNFIRTVHEKEEIALNEQDFQSISELAGIVAAVENDSQLWNGAVLSSIITTSLYYNGNIYGGTSARSRYFHELIGKVVQLSPLSVSWTQID